MFGEDRDLRIMASHRSTTEVTRGKDGVPRALLCGGEPEGCERLRLFAPHIHEKVLGRINLACSSCSQPPQKSLRKTCIQDVDVAYFVDKTNTMVHIPRGVR